MPQGLELWDASGNQQLDYTSSAPLILGYVDSGTSDGSFTITHALRDAGTLFTLSQFSRIIGYGPQVTLSGYTINWSFLVTAATLYLSKGNTRIFYGIK